MTGLEPTSIHKKSWRKPDFSAGSYPAGNKRAVRRKFVRRASRPEVGRLRRHSLKRDGLATRQYFRNARDGLARVRTQPVMDRGYLKQMRAKRLLDREGTDTSDSVQGDEAFRYVTKIHWPGSGRRERAQSVKQREKGAIVSELTGKKRNGVKQNPLFFDQDPNHRRSFYRKPHTYNGYPPYRTGGTVDMFALRPTGARLYGSAPYLPSLEQPDSGISSDSTNASSQDGGITINFPKDFPLNTLRPQTKKFREIPIKLVDHEGHIYGSASDPDERGGNNQNLTGAWYNNNRVGGDNNRVGGGFRGSRVSEPYLNSRNDQIYGHVHDDSRFQDRIRRVSEPIYESMYERNNDRMSASIHDDGSSLSTSSDSIDKAKEAWNLSSELEKYPLRESDSSGHPPSDTSSDDIKSKWRHIDVDGLPADYDKLSLSDDPEKWPQSPQSDHKSVKFSDDTVDNEKKTKRVLFRKDATDELGLYRDHMTANGMHGVINPGYQGDATDGDTTHKRTTVITQDTSGGSIPRFMITSAPPTPRDKGVEEQVVTIDLPSTEVSHPLPIRIGNKLKKSDGDVTKRKRCLKIIKWTLLAVIILALIAMVIGLTLNFTKPWQSEPD